jgi:transposase-like protein
VGRGRISLMKNLVDPKILAELKQEPVSHERIAAFLEGNKEITAAQLCKLLEVDPQQYYNWKSRRTNRTAANSDFDVIPVGADKKNYSASDKLKLIKRYITLEGEKRTEFLRTYGLYDSDLVRWLEKVDEAALVALSTRKPRCDKKSTEQIENERLNKELRGQEKTIAKLSAIVVAQKKISELLKDEDDSD